MSNRHHGMIGDFLDRGARPVPGLDGYYVNASGEVFSVMQLKPFPHKDGYMHVNTFARQRRYRPAVHTLVALTFVGPKPPGMQVRHLNGKRLNNDPSNLKWGTAKENSDDKIRHGRGTRGTSNPRSILNLAKVRAIRRMHAKGKTCRSIAAVYGIAMSTVDAVVSRRNWGHVK